MSFNVIEGGCLEVLPKLPSQSVDAVITDPPYPEVDRDYGRISEADWVALMYGVVPELKRVLRPNGSAVLILQPNSKKIGQMRMWLWEFLCWVGKTWNVVQDVYWWNYTTIPNVHTRRENGLLRTSVKYCVWLGEPNCYRNQESVLMNPSAYQLAMSGESRIRVNNPSGFSVNRGRMVDIVKERGGVTPFNLLPISNADSRASGGAKGHSGATPLKLLNWWVRYIVPPGGVVLDPFCGSGTSGVAALDHGHSFIGIERVPKYVEMANNWLSGCEKSSR